MRARTGGRHARSLRLRLDVEGTEDGAEVLGVGEETYDVQMVWPHEVEPAARKPLHPSRAQSRDVADLTDSWRAATRHSLDGLQRGDRCVEERSATSAPASVAE
jgi:hypothetical protein